MADITSNATTAGLWSAACRLFGDRSFLVHLDAAAAARSSATPNSPP